jgi:hypothetical protein
LNVWNYCPGAQLRTATVAPISKSAVSRVSKPADPTPAHDLPIENRRYSRLGNLRYRFASTANGGGAKLRPLSAWSSTVC